MKKFCLGFIFLAASIAAWADDGIVVSGAWARATAPGQTTGAVYLEIRSARKASLTGGETPAARKVELHATTLDANVMRMRPVARIELPENTSVKIAPGGFHLMLVDVRRPLKAGERIPLTLFIDRDGVRSRVAVTAEVRAAGDGAVRQHVH